MFISLVEYLLKN